MLHGQKKSQNYLLRYSNLKGYGIENLQHDISQGYLSQTYVNSVKSAGTSINPKLQFISLCTKEL